MEVYFIAEKKRAPSGKILALPMFFKKIKHRGTEKHGALTRCLYCL